MLTEDELSGSWSPRETGFWIDLGWQDSEEIAVEGKAEVIVDQTECHTQMGKLLKDWKPSFLFLYVALRKHQGNDRTSALNAI